MVKQSIKRRAAEVGAVSVLLLLFTLILSYLLLVDAPDSTDRKETAKFRLSVNSCEEAGNKAEEDFKRGVIRMYFSSDVVDGHHEGFPYNFYDSLENDLGIDVIFTGDACCSFSSCYNSRMDNLLGKRLGKHTIEDLFNKLHDEAYPR